MSWNLKEIYKALNKRFKNTENIEFQRVSIDSRKISSKDFFIPIVGENHDGHNFIDEISNFGVKACLVERKKDSLDDPRSKTDLEVKEKPQRRKDTNSR